MVHCPCWPAGLNADTLHGRLQLDVTWLEHDGLRVINRRPGSIVHPITGKRAYVCLRPFPPHAFAPVLTRIHCRHFNHSAVFHIAMVTQEFRRIAAR